MDGFRLRPIFFAAATALLSAAPAIAETPAEPPSYQPYYYVTSQGASPPAIPLDTAPTTTTAPVVETYPAEAPIVQTTVVETPVVQPPVIQTPAAETPAVAVAPAAPAPAVAPSAPVPSTVKNLNDELPANLAPKPPAPAHVSVTPMAPAPVTMPMMDQQPVLLPSTVQITPPQAPMPMAKAPAASADVAIPPTPTKTSYNDLPSYQYSPNYDTRTAAFKTPKAKDPHAKSSDAVSVETQSGFTLGAQISDYRYQEHTTDESTDFVRMMGPKVGFTLDYTGMFPGNYFIAGDVRFAGGENEYHGSGKIRGIPDYIFETRLLGGKDFIFEDAFGDGADLDVTPYAGLGFRYLYDQLSVENVGGYDRYSHYIYIPVGETTRFRVTEDSRLSLNAEFDKLVYGWQESDLDDNGGGGPELVNPQYNGYGLRGSAMWEWKHWGVGPFINYWNIGYSKLTTSSGTIFTEGGWEPENQTLEGGLQVNYKF